MSCSSTIFRIHSSVDNGPYSRLFSKHLWPRRPQLGQSDPILPTRDLLGSPEDDQIRVRTPNSSRVPGG